MARADGGGVPPRRRGTARPRPVRVKRSKVAARLLLEDARVPMRDGVRLATDLVVPDDGERYPALVIRGPYSRASARAMQDPVALARMGWGVLIQDCRGRFDSEGDFEPFHSERADGADTIAWAAAQPWCDGRVATLGMSYLGFTQWQAALDRPPALGAMAPLIVGGDVREGWTYEGGALQLGLVAPWGLAIPMTTPGASPEVVSKGIDMAMDWDRFLRHPPARNPLGDLLPAFSRWLRHDDQEYWKPLSITRAYHRIDVPVFQVAGWYDLFAESSLANFTGMREQAPSEYARRSQRLVVGPWPHTSLYLNASAEFDFGPAANALAENLPGKVVEWLGAALDGEDVEGGVRAYVMGPMGQGEWREYESWPPPSTPTTWYLSSERGANGLHGDGRLVGRPDEDARSDRYLYDPERPVPTRGGRILGPYLPSAGPVDQRPVEERDDVLVYTSDPLPRDVTIIGAVTADVTFATSGRSADVTVKLCDVYPDGRSYNILDSVKRSAFTPGHAKRITVEVGSVAKRFPAGHRIRVEVSSSNFPRLDRNPSTGAEPWEATVYEPAVQTVRLGGQRPSSITLPVVDA